MHVYGIEHIEGQLVFGTIVAWSVQNLKETEAILVSLEAKLVFRWAWFLKVNPEDSKVTKSKCERVLTVVMTLLVGQEKQLLWFEPMPPLEDQISQSNEGQHLSLAP